MTKLDERDLELFNEVLKDYLVHPEVRKMNEYCAHGKITVLEHSVNVARKALQLNRSLGLNADIETLLVGALLHDFYLYDWHDMPLNVNIFRMHGYTHAAQACENAIRYFDVNENIQEVIRCHMWPLTLRSFPRHKEAVLVCMADKLCAMKETIHDR